MNWVNVKLENIADEKQENYEPNKNESLSYIGLEHIEQQTLRLNGIGKSNETISSKKKFSPNDILFGSLRPYFRKVYKPKFNGVCSTDITVIQNKKNFSQDYLFYLIANQSFIDYATNFSNGTRMPRANWGVISKSEWRVPKEKKHQQKIASILSVYDDLIENNTHRIKILEEMAQAIYKEWFVNFRFPNYEKTKFVDSPLGKIPKEWEVKKLGEVISFIKGKKFKKTFTEPRNGLVNLLLLDSISNGNYQFVEQEERMFVNENDIVMVMDGASSGKIFTGLYGCLGSTLASIKIIDKSISNYQLYYFLIDNFTNISDNNTGSAIPHANKEYINQLDFLITNNQLRKRFDNIIESIHSQILNLKIKNQNLRKTRDLLLPKLISGKIEI